MGLRKRSYVMTGTKEWFAIYTKPRWEKKVFAGLLQQGITAYCPMNRVMKQWSDRKKMIDVPLFTSYIFVQINAEEQLKVRMTAGVVNFVYWLGKMARIREEEISALQAFVDAHSQIRVEEAGYSKGAIYEFSSGIFKGKQAIVEEVRNNKLELVLKSMNVKLVVDYIPSKQTKHIGMALS